VIAETKFTPVVTSVKIVKENLTVKMMMIAKEGRAMNELEAKALKDDIIGKMYGLGFWLAAEIQQTPDNPEKVLQFRRMDGAEVFITIKR